MTHKLYLQDSYTTQFEAQVLDALKKGVGVVAARKRVDWIRPIFIQRGRTTE